jgi:uncharacterized protein YecE (DUF72 family)
VSEVLLGTSSWSTPGWVGPFYPEGSKPADHLAFYSTQFRAVEADVTYYRVPSESMVTGWRDRTPDGFTICAKFPRTVVHAGAGPKPDRSRILVPEACWEDTEAFVTAMSLLGEKCGPLVLQFPYFAADCFADVAEFLERLDAYLELLPKTLRYAVEVRNRTWLGEPLTAVLRRHEVALVLVEMNYMPHPADVAGRLDVVTTDFLYGRLIGDRKAVEALTKRFDEIVVDQSASLRRWADLMGALSERAPRTWLFANNHYAGHGPETIRELGRLMGLID